MSETPITDKNTWTTVDGNLRGVHSEDEADLNVPVSVARKLERELNAAKANAESWREQAERFGQQLLEANERLKLLLK